MPTRPRHAAPLALALLAAAALTPGALAQGPSPNDIARWTPGGTTIITQGPRPTWGVGAGRSNINLLSTRRYYTTFQPPVVRPHPLPRPCPTPSPPITIQPWPPVCAPTPPVCGPVVRPVVGSGLTVGGSYSGDRFNLDFRLGAPTGLGTPLAAPCAAHPTSHCATPCVPLVGNPFRYSHGVYYSAGRVWGASPAVLPRTDGPLDPRLFREQPAPTPQPAQAEPPRSLAEVGVYALREKRAADAVVALRRHLDTAPDDARAMRVLAIALLEDRRAADAAAVMRLAYRTDPLLARERLSPEALGFSTREFRNLVTRAVGHANSVRSSSAWLSVSVLMQGEIRDDLALAMLARAADAGLDPAVADALRAELAR